MILRTLLDFWNHHQNVLSIYNPESKDIIDKLKLDASSLKKLVDVVTNNHPENATKIPDAEYF